MSPNRSERSNLPRWNNCRVSGANSVLMLSPHAAIVVVLIKWGPRVIPPGPNIYFSLLSPASVMVYLPSFSTVRLASRSSLITLRTR